MKYWKVTTVALVVLILIWSSLLVLKGRRSVPKPIVIRAAVDADFRGSAALQYAAKRYRQRGAKYIWGTNDCSVFVSDYLLRLPHPPKTRLTTWNLNQVDVEPFGLTIEGSVKPGDVLNYRYRSRKRNEVAGHCGVVVQKPDGLWVVHNCVSMGLAIQRISSFYTTAQSLGVSKLEVTVLRPKK
ncbi:MAG: hypothetical protein WCK51_12325 [Armatimonadota bacterium]